MASLDKVAHTTKPIPTRRQLSQKVAAEAVGTFALVFAGCGAIAVNHMTNGALGHLGVCAVFGLVIMVMIYATGHICGAHFNPAVTLAFAIAGRFPWRQVGPYIAGQLAAALLASLALVAVFGSHADFAVTTVSGSLGQSFVLEVIATFFLMFVIISVATDVRAAGNLAGLAIGGTVALGALFAGPVSGASMNPARSLGPAIATGKFDDIWLYIAAPIAGAIIGAMVFVYISCTEKQTNADGCC